MPRKKSTSKRANNEGSVYKNKRGLWVAQATIGYDENGKQIRKAVSGKTRSDAIANLASYLPKNGARKQLILLLFATAPEKGSFRAFLTVRKIFFLPFVPNTDNFFCLSCPIPITDKKAPKMFAIVFATVFPVFPSLWF